MDYRCTEDFARRMEAAERRALQVRNEAIGAFFRAVAHGIARAWHALRRPRKTITLEA